MGAFLAKITDRQGGKTHFLLNLMRKNPEMVVLVPTAQQGRFYTDAGIDQARVISAPWDQRLRGRRGPVAIDNAEDILRGLLGLMYGEDLIITATGLNA